MNNSILRTFTLLIISFLVCSNSSFSSNKKEPIYLKQLIFADKYEKMDFQTEGICFENIIIPKQKEFIKVMTPYIGMPISMELLNKIKVDVNKFYRKNGYPLVAVKIPVGQDISNGILCVVISIGKLGNVHVEGAKYFSKDKIAKCIRIKQGDEIKNDIILEDMEWLNDNPFRCVDFIYEKGKNISETDIRLQVLDKVPVRVYGGYENTGNEVAGPSRWIGGINFGNFLGLDHQVNFQFISATDPKSMWGVMGSYIIPFSWRHMLKALGCYTITQPHLDPSQRMKGKGWYTGLRYEMRLPVIKKYSHDIIIGYDFKSTNNFLSYARNLIYDNERIDISQFLLKYQAMLEDNFGMNSLEVMMFFSPGKMTKNNTNKQFQLERSGAKANYFYMQLEYERLTKIKMFSWVFDFLGQISTQKLLPSEQLSLGGYLTVRGYMENEVSGDKGFLIKNELRFPPIKFRTWKLKNELQILAFMDFGIVGDVDQNILRKESAILWSIGPGARYIINENLNARFDYGWQLKSVHGRITGLSGDSRAHLGITLSI